MGSQAVECCPVGHYRSGPARYSIYGAGDGEFVYARGIAIDSSNNVYVVDDKNRIQKFDSSGTFLAKWGSYGGGDGEFSHPFGIAVDSSDNVYVADRTNSRIQKFDSSGTFLTKWSSEFAYPFGIAVDSSDNVYVADRTNCRIQKFDSSGTFLTKWGHGGSGDGEFSSPNALAVDSSGDVYVTGFAGDAAFIMRRDESDGGDQWTEVLEPAGAGSVRPVALSTDSSGNVTIVGTFQGLVDFDPDDGFRR